MNNKNDKIKSKGSNGLTASQFAKEFPQLCLKAERLMTKQFECLMISEEMESGQAPKPNDVLKAMRIAASKLSKGDREE